MIKKIVSVTFTLFLILLCSCGKIQNEELTSTVPETTAVISTETHGENGDYPSPVDFSEYMSVNREVYAFISIPGTGIEYPIVQSGASDDYYLRRNWKGEQSYRGCIFTQSMNAKEFTDPVTVIYGHNTDKGDMFSELLKFKDTGFFYENDTFYIFIPGHLLVYKIISAHTFDDRHILNSYDFTSPDALADFQQIILNPTALEKNVRTGIELNPQSEIVVLSTCAEAKSGGNLRFLVNGVLVKDVLTV
jgi:sortase B